MKLTKNNRNSVSVGDVLRFSYGDAYTVVTIIHHQHSRICITLEDVKTKQHIYGFPISACYGAEIEKA